MGVLSHLPAGSGSFYPYQIDQSCRFNDDDSARTTAAQGVPTSGLIYTFSFWVKRCALGVHMTMLGTGTAAADQSAVRFTSTDEIQIFLDNTTGGSVTTIDKYRDVSSWYHVVVVVDTPQGTASNRNFIYVNGVSTTLTGTNFSLNYQGSINENGKNITVGAADTGSYSFYLNGYLAETHFIDGQALSPSDFGETKSGVWVPKEYTGTYGNNGFYLDYSNSAHFGEDQSGNGNDFTDSGLATNDQVEDSPTNNWCTMNSTVPQSIGGTISNGNLVCTTTVGSVEALVSTMPLIAGKGYCEVTITDVGVGTLIGIISADADFDGTQNIYTDANSVSYYSTGALYAGGGLENAGYGAAYTTSDIIGIAVDVSGQTITFYKNNATQGSVDISGWDEGAGWIFGIGDASGGGAATVTSWNFGQLGFAYTPPTGFKAINSSNMSSVSSLYLEGSKGFDTVIYTGTGAEKAITSLEFSPDLVWIKNRDAADEHVLTDTVRGATKEINSNSTNAESTVAQGVKSFDSAGFTLGTQAEYNTNAENYVAWNWKEDPNYGFDIVAYTGTGANRTIAHSLGVTPEMIIIKNKDSAQSWIVTHDGIALDEILVLNSTAAASVGATYFNSRGSDSSSVFTIGTHNSTNTNGDNYISYLFASIEGFSKVFSYTGNANADGPFVYCGFRPRYIMMKNTDSVSDWHVFDSERELYNVQSNWMTPNASAIENTASFTDVIDFLSNGFKLRESHPSFNRDTMMGIAFAETPFKYANAR